MEFSELALQKLLQVLPELSQYILTFKDMTEDLNQEETSDLSVGSFILAVGGSYLYVPVFMKSGAIQPIDSFFDPASSKFMPLTRNYVNKILSVAQLQIGQGTNVPATVNKNPSVYDLVVPPRTGKFIYAGTSRFTEFLHSAPTLTKKAFVEALLKDATTAEAINKVVNIAGVIKAIKESEELDRNKVPASTVAQNSIQVITSGENLAHEEVQDILTKGYALRGIQKDTRIAISETNVNEKGSLREVGTGATPGEYEVVLNTGDVQTAFIPKRAKSIPTYVALLSNRYSPNNSTFVLFPNGDYAITSKVVSVGEPKVELNVLRTAFEYNPPKLPRDIARDDTVAIFTPEMELAGVFRADAVSLSGNGVTIRAYSYLSENVVVIHALRNCTTFNGQDRENLYIPFRAIVIPLRNRIDERLEVNINAAQAHIELSTLRTLGDRSSIGFHSGTFSYNNKPIGNHAKIIELLIVKEGIDPVRAENFVKQAEELKHLTVYLSKRAEYSPGEIEQYGDAPVPAPEERKYGNWPGAEFNTNVSQAVQVGDSQTTEATLLTELLQAPDMLEYVNEYLPDIEEAIDKLGRILFLSRLNMIKLFSGDNATEIFSFISGLRNVYRTLGDNYLKLERFSSEFGNQGMDEEVAGQVKE